MPVAMGIVNENVADDNALNITSADANINKKAIITCILIKNSIQSLILLNIWLFRFILIIAAPDTLRVAYNEQYIIALIIVNLIQ